MVPLLNGLWDEDNSQSKKIALATIFCFTSGCRMKEALNVLIEDIRYETNPTTGVEFLIIPIRVSKTNPFAMKREQLHIPLPNRALFDLKPMINFLKGF